MTFRNKILISIWGVVLSLLVITFFIINYWIRSRIETTFSRELRAEYQTVAVAEQLQTEQLIRACVVVAESPRLRAVAELGDASTATQLLQELYQTTLSQVVVLTDRKGTPLVQLLRGAKDRWNIPSLETIQRATHYIASTNVWALRGVVYRVVSVPIVIETELVGTLTSGFEISSTDLGTIKRATNSDLLLVNDDAIVLSTLDSSEARSLLPLMVSHSWTPPPSAADTAGIDFTLKTQDETYLGTAFRLSRLAAAEGGGIFYVIIKPLSREVRQSMASILTNFGFASLLFLALTTIVGLVISRSMTRPIQRLVTGTTEIARGNYDFKIDVRGRDELSYLAQRFMEMSASLKEKISLLGQLNDNLMERNRDLDETLRQLQTAQEKLVRSERLAATGKLTAQLAHEINNPIHNIQSCLKTALGRLPQDIKGRDLIDVAYDEVNRLSRLTVQMLDFYRNTLVEEEMKPVDLNALLGEVLAMTQQELQARNIAVESKVDPGLPPIRGSRDKLIQVLVNLISNARDAMPHGGNLGLLAQAQNGAVRIMVRDSGVGIPRENLNRIFDAFFTTKSKVSGVGLGLSVSYGIVRLHRGTIEVESEPGLGSAFTVVLPL